MVQGIDKDIAVKHETGFIRARPDAARLPDLPPAIPACFFFPSLKILKL
jgi:hypothetical protein